MSNTLPPSNTPQVAVPSPNVEPLPLTYEQLLTHGCALAERQGMKPQQQKNLATALRQWVNQHGFTMSRLVGSDFTDGFDTLFVQHCDAIAEQLAPRSQRDRQELLLRWRRLAQMLRQQDNLPQAFGAALAQCIQASPLSRAALAREVGLSPTALRHWVTEKGYPIGDTLQFIPRLEAALEVPHGALSSRLPLARRTRYARGQTPKDTSSSFTKTVQRQRQSFPRRPMPFTGRIREQWQTLARFKADAFREHAFARNTWRLKPIERTSIRVIEPMLVDGQICVTSGVQWQSISPYMGWLSSPAPNGLNLAADVVDTLAWLTHPEHIIAYARWLIRRSGQKFHNGVNVFLASVESYLRPTTGFVWLHPELAATLPPALYQQLSSNVSPGEPHEVWQALCRQTREKVLSFRLKVIDQMGIKRSRDPAERAAVVLNNEFPLRKLVEFVEMLERSMPPPAHTRDYKAWLRNVTLCRLLISNPLRIGQYAAMTYRADGTGKLVRLGPGRYRLQFEPADFKNENGAAHEPYEVDVDASASPWIDRYLAEARPYMVGAEETDRFFLATTEGPRKGQPFLEAEGLQTDIAPDAQALSAIFKKLTSEYLDGCSGFGAHACRHAIATDHLRRHPGDYVRVAKLLHDKLATVLKDYSHLQVQDGLRVLGSGIAQASAELAAGRKQR